MTADTPITLNGGVRISIPAGAAELRFDGAVFTETDLSNEANAPASTALDALPVNLSARGALLVFTRCGDVAIPVHLESPAPDASLDAYAWDGTQWTWLAGATDQLSVDLPDIPKVVAWVESLPIAPTIGTQPDPQTAGLDPQYHGVITEIYAPGLSPAANGSVIGQVPTAPAPGSPYGVHPVISNLVKGQTDVDSVAAMLRDAPARKTHVETLASIANGSNFAGVAIDYRGLTADSRDAYASLVEDLAAALHANGKLLISVLPTQDPESRTAYDWGRIGRAADVVQIELPIEVSRYEPADSAMDIFNWAAKRIDRHKLQPIVSAASVSGLAEGASAISFAQAVNELNASATAATVSATVGTSLTITLQPAATLAFDATSGVYHYPLSRAKQLDSPDSTRRIYTAATLAMKLNALADLRLRGVVIRDVQGPDAAPNLLNPIKAYRQQSAISGSSELSVNWTIAASDGSVVLDETRPLAGADLTWMPDRQGTFTVKAGIGSLSRGVALITVGEAALAGGVGTGVVTADTDATGGNCYSASYVADITVPDHTRFDKNKEFTKTWRVRNNGTCAWSADTELVFVGGAQLGAAGPVKVGALEVGKTIDISVAMKAPEKDGAYTGVWQVRNKDGAYGDPVSVVIKVGAEGVAPLPPLAPPVGGGPTAYGIHAHYYGYIDTASGAQGIVDYTNELGLGWTKIQFRWGDYDYYCNGPDLNVLNTMIGAANATGLKVLLSVVTAPPCTHPWTADVHAPPDDPAAYAELVGGLADLFRGRIHAIEVWNEQNISREWLTRPQKIDAARYVKLLAAAYDAIKSKDPNILVIGGALAPTGWNDGVNATDDFSYLQQMVAAGAAQYMDCVGVHVNALRIPPSAGLGSEYDSLFSPPHHSWYFKDTLQGSQSLSGKPACVTEFGVASSETIGGVPGFEWAADNTPQEQADWVTEGMGLCRQWGCRLMILWNLDYGPATRLVNDNALYSFIDMGLGRRPVFHAVKSWCAANGCK